jgi:hypothetical protein
MLIKTTCSRLRHSHVLGHYDPALELFTVLLRVAGAEHPETRHDLEHLGFVPEQSDKRTAISWKRRIVRAELGTRAAELIVALSGEVLLDVGSACPDALGRIHSRLEPGRDHGYWPGYFLLHAPKERCVVFDRSVHATEIERALLDESRDYFAREFNPPTE